MTVFVRSPHDAEETDKIYAFLYEIWVNELQYETPDMNHDTRRMQDTLDTWAKHFLAIDDTGKIVGCMRNNLLSGGISPPDISDHLQLSTLFELYDSDKINLTSRLAIDRSARGKTVTSQLVIAGYSEALAAGADVVICYAALHLVHLYYQLGFRPYAPTFHLTTGTRIPLILCMRDRTYLKSVDSPFFNFLPASQDDSGAAASKLKSRFLRFENPGFDRSSRQMLWAQLAHVPEQSSPSDGISLFQGLSEKELSHAMIKLTRITFDAGETVVNRNECVSCIGVLLSGRLGIGMFNRDKPKLVSMLTPGEPFGALSGDDIEKRALDMVALEKSEVVLLPLGSLRRLNVLGNDVVDRITRNLLRILAQRVHKGQQTIASLIEGGEHEVRVRSTVPPPPTPKTTEKIVESYGFESLVDKNAEYNRLILQATVAENTEISKLTQIGLKDGGTIVDVGSGPGIVSTLFGKYFPNSKIWGIEPDYQLREMATKTAAHQGCRHCTFLEGMAEKIPLDDNVADFTYARLLFQHLPNPLAALKEMHRITTKNGIVAIMDVDDGFIITKPEIPGWSELQQMVAKTQKTRGGNRFVGRELLSMMIDAGLEAPYVEALPFTSHDIGQQNFYRLVFGFKRQILERAGELTEKRRKIFDQAEKTIRKPDTFAIVVIILAHGRAKGRSDSGLPSI